MLKGLETSRLRCPKIKAKTGRVHQSADWQAETKISIHQQIVHNRTDMGDLQYFT